jgi:hypothetical protein
VEKSPIALMIALVMVFVLNLMLQHLCVNVLLDGVVKHVQSTINV